ncbi:RNA-splicing ligase RtcB [Candidatus Woesearchaeota archaeon]|nr:RNA-splicing ligase RtcB [Candidatus Woesearchaeota archaeon]|tara:strand:- start:2208 stop:5255 length:3048 start_codon:yes stop_codon:yes gene_type:complete
MQEKQLPPLKRIDKAEWEISTDYKKGMQVPAKIFATEALLKNMDYSVYDQLTNVATLPGIINHAMCMPDGHSGYGFPIGGVAAFDTEKGIISPGGVGFDINCLVKGSQIMTEFGYKKPIQDFEAGFIDIENPNSPYILKSKKYQQSILSFDIDQKLFSSKEILYFMKKKHFGSIFQIKTRLGYAIQVTEDHPILTKKGMIKANALKKEQEIAICPFKGVSYEEITDNKLLIESETIYTKQEKDELKKRDLLHLNSRHPKLPLITKLFGYLLGDGSIYFSGKKGYVNAYGPEEDLKKIQADFKKLGFSAKIYSRLREHDIPTKYGNVNFKTKHYELHVPSKSLAKLFFALGYPQGTKTSVSYLIPGWIMQGPLWIKRLFLSGFFGAELSKPRTHTKTGFDCPTVSINKNSILLDNVREFSIQIMCLLEEFGVKTHKLQERKDYKNRFGPTHRIKLQISSEENNLLNLWEKIGFSYNKKRELLSRIGILYIKEKKLLTQKRKEIASKIKELKRKGLKLKEVTKLINSPYCNERFIERHYYENAAQRITLSFTSFNDFIKLKNEELSEYGTLYDKIEYIKKIPYDDYVYDFNVPKTHSFIANNFVVSNCGVRLVLTNLTYNDVKDKTKSLVNNLFEKIPAGVGRKGELRLNESDFREVVEQGSKWCIEKGYGWKEDLEKTEEKGHMDGADSKAVSSKAISRGLSQIGTLGSGNHYLELQHVREENIFDKEIAKKLGLFPDQIVMMVHCGSRGFGHQVASDYLQLCLKAMKSKYNMDILDRELSCVPFKSKEGQDYFSAMKCAVNMAFANRQLIMHRIREVFSEIFSADAEKLGLKLVYDVCHNIAKLENHIVDGKEKEVLVHRKGATRAFGPGRKELPKEYQKIGQPVIIGGSMETGSYLLLGTDEAERKTFASTAHGSGRVMSRSQAKRTWRGETLQKDLEKKGIYIKTTSFAGLAEEAGGAYKPIASVIDACETAGISKPVAKFLPIGNIKGTAGLSLIVPIFVIVLTLLISLLAF